MPRRKKTIQTKSSPLKKPQNQQAENLLPAETQVIPCTLKSISEFSFKAGEMKLGRYDGCLYPVIDYGYTKWAFSCYIRPTGKDLENYLLDGLTELDVLKGCIAFLNLPPAREKYQKKVSMPLLGTIDLEPLYFKIKKIDETDYFVATLLTDSQKNKNLWGEGYCPGKIGKREENDGLT